MESKIRKKNCDFMLLVNRGGGEAWSDEREGDQGQDQAPATSCQVNMDHQHLFWKQLSIK